MLTSFFSIFGKSMQRATHCGSWYPSGSELRRLLDSVFSNVKKEEIPGIVKAVISPHAGYRYCAETAAHAFSCIDPNLYDRVIIMGPSHRLYREDNTIVDAKQMETPFGNLDIDTATAEKLVSENRGLFARLDVSNAEDEHSLEMMLPFLKYVFGEKKFTVLPIMVGHLTEDAQIKTAEIIGNLIADERTFLCISSDFTHWGARFRYTYLPDGDQPYWQRISKIDHDAMDAISTTDVAQFKDYIKQSKATICGRVPIMIAMMALKKPFRVDWPHYSQSSHVENMSDSSVSYAGGVLRLL